MSLLTAHPAARPRAHPQLRLPSQPPPCHSPTALLSPSRFGTTTANPTKRLLHQRLFRSLALPQVRWPDDGRRAAYGCSNPTSLSTGGHRCSMKALSPIRVLRVPQRGSHLSAWPSDYFLLSASSTSFFILLFRRNQLLHARCHVVHTVANLYTAPSRHLNFHRTLTILFAPSRVPPPCIPAVPGPFR